MLRVWYSTSGAYVADKRMIKVRFYITDENKAIVKTVCESNGVPVVRDAFDNN